MRGVKTKNSGRFKKWGIFLCLTALLFLLLNSLNNVYQKKREAEKTLAYMQNELGELKNRNEFLKNSIAQIQTKEGLEFEIRKKFNVAEVGESVAIIVEEKSTATTSPANYSPWQKFKNFFTNLFK